MTHDTPAGGGRGTPGDTAAARAPADRAPVPRRRRIVLTIAALVAVAAVVVVGTRVWTTPAAPPPSARPSPGATPTTTTTTAPPGSALAAWPRWSTIRAATVDLAAAPRRHVDRALALVRAADPADPGAHALFALDPADGTWVRLDLPEGIPAPGDGIALSADGRSIATTGDGPDVRLYDLATGGLRTVTIPPAVTTGCRSAWSSFSPDGTHLAVLSACGTELSEGAPGRSTTVVDIDLTSRDIRQIALQNGAYPPPHQSIAYSPDGAAIAVGTLAVGSDTEGTLAVVARDGTTVARWTGTFTVDTVNPWRDDHTLLGAGLDSSGSGTRLWLDTTTSTSAAAVVAPPDTNTSLTPMLFSDGMLVARADPTSGDTPGPTLWVYDTEHGTRAPWLTFTGVSVLSVLLPAEPSPSTSPPSAR